jgi:hypothetical protein
MEPFVLPIVRTMWISTGPLGPWSIIRAWNRQGRPNSATLVRQIHKY